MHESSGLDGRRPGTDDRHLLARKVSVGVQGERVDDVAAESHQYIRCIGKTREPGR